MLESNESKGCCEPMPPRGPIGATEIDTGEKKRAPEQKECGSQSGRGARCHRAERPRRHDNEQKKGEAKRPVAGPLSWAHASGVVDGVLHDGMMTGDAPASLLL